MNITQVEEQPFRGERQPYNPAENERFLTISIICACSVIMFLLVPTVVYCLLAL